MRSLFVTQQEIDQAYAEGKAAYFKDVGTHGPTLRQPRISRTYNPYRPVELMLAWDRGYNQDTRKVIANG